ncbi:hypothetical protein [Paraburkholderia fynbosensis]|uniref:hypothetical protein n=1 Tax=Paraburkholderia fynbosensis TaxID=1200993 RepID=UPI001C2E96BB
MRERPSRVDEGPTPLRSQVSTLCKHRTAICRPAPNRFGHFDVVDLDNGVSLDFAKFEGRFQPQHYAFLISEADFDA